MKMGWMCAIALGCSAVMAGAANAQSCAGMAMGKGGDMDKQFLMTASQGDYTEITFSKLALDKSTNPQVKAYAQKMIDDHTKLETEMKPFADKMGVTPATSLDQMHQQLYDQLSQQSGVDFDKGYMNGMDKDHHQTLDAFKTEISSTQNAEMKPTLKKGEKVVAEHTKMADSMVKKMSATTSGM